DSFLDSRDSDPLSNVYFVREIEAQEAFPYCAQVFLGDGCHGFTAVRDLNIGTVEDGKHPLLFIIGCSL
ncbi:MAG: hypothetical protein ACNYZI_03135, partial [Anaerolineales bacterium]